ILLDANLVEEAERNIISGQVKRYRQHRLLRIYARALLEDAGETTTVFERCRNHYITHVQNHLKKEEFRNLFLDVPNLDEVWKHGILTDTVDNLIETQKAVDEVLNKWSRHHDRISIV